MSYDEAMASADSPTNLAWQINQSNPDARVDAMESQADVHKPRGRPTADFASLAIDTELLDR